MSKIMKNIWSLPRYKREWHNICALLPAYLPDGCNGSYILYEDGSEEEVHTHKNKNPKMPLFRIMRHSGNANFHKAWYTAK